MRHTGSFRCLFLLLLLAAQTGAQQSAPKGEWRFYGGDQGSSKYSPLDQINEQNVRRLQIVWTWDSPDKQIQATHRMLAPFAYEVTPLMVGGVLYVSTSFSQVAAIEAQTGETLWVFDTESYQRGRPTNLGFVHRGVAYWTDGRQARIFIGTGNAFLWAIDAKTGQPVAEFGDGGKVDLAKAIPLADNARNYAVTSPPLVCRDIVMVGSSISDAVTNKEAPRGDLQAFDVRTGKPAWLFHTVPQGDEPETRTWEQESWKYSGGTNCWSLMSADPELGYVYIPTGTPTNDWYGGHRLGDNLFADSLICLEAQTGKRVWHFQTVHHGLWDYDV
ncbi:MAG TPA: PQQ-binding-like beta-propeller repeat protein, partial [Blastocatellia bacterium]|nr:PQQ-binding-like beta-propeller repeat protein [Blastocatellia bacterium]